MNSTKHAATAATAVIGTCLKCGLEAFRLNHYCNACFQEVKKAALELKLDHLVNPFDGSTLSKELCNKFKSEGMDVFAWVILYFDNKLWKVLQENFQASVDDWMTIVWVIQNNPQFQAPINEVLRRFY